MPGAAIRANANGAQPPVESANRPGPEQALTNAHKDPVFTEFFRPTNGWVAGDGALSVPLSDGRVLWLFGDSFIDCYELATRTIPCLFQVRNTAMVHDKGDLTHARTLLNANTANRTLFQPPANTQRWFWPVSGFQQGNTVYVYLTRLKPGGGLGFEDRPKAIRVPRQLLTVPNPKPAAWSPPADKPRKEQTPLPAFARGLPKEDLACLRDMTRDVVEASRVKPGSNGGGRWPLTNSCGFTLITPGKDTYTAFWVRDFSMAVDSGFITPEELRNHLLLICQAQNGPAELKLANGLHVPPWAIPDHINYDGRPSNYPGSYSSGPDQGNGACGRVPPIDDHYEFVHIAYTYWKGARDARIFQVEVSAATVFDRLERAFACPTTDPITGLAETTEADRAVGFGFCDGETHTGKLLFASLLRYRAAGELAELAGALGHRDRTAAYRKVQKTIRANLARTFCDPQTRDGWLRASTGLSAQPDVWGTLFALHLGVLDRPHADAARKTVADAVKRGTITLEGGVRQVPTDRDFSKTTAWERSMCPLNTYQNGGYWHTASGWLIEALWKQDRPLALQVFGEMLVHLRAQDFRKGPGHGAPWEVFGPNGTARQNGVYLASVALPYGILKRL